MRKMSCHDLYEKGWEYGLWDDRNRQWDALTVDIKDAFEWSQCRSSVTIYSLETGSPMTFDDV